MSSRLVVVGAKISQEELTRLDRMAAELDRSRSWLLRQALKRELIIQGGQGQHTRDHAMQT